MHGVQPRLRTISVRTFDLLMNHPKLTKALAALDAARTQVADVLESHPGNAGLEDELNLINRAILDMPHIKTAPAMKLWVDGERPAPEGWVWSKTVENTIATLELSPGGISEMSLDYCLDRGQDAGAILEWLRDHPQCWPTTVVAHSSSAAGRELIEVLVKEWKP